MKIFLISSRRQYHHIPDVALLLEQQGHELIYPNSFADPDSEKRVRVLGKDEHSAWKKEKLHESIDKVRSADAVLVFNYEKEGVSNYIGGATFLEMYQAFLEGKSIYLMNPVPAGILADEIEGFEPIILNGDLSALAGK